MEMNDGTVTPPFSGVAPFDDIVGTPVESSMDSSVESQKESYSKGPSRKGKRQSQKTDPNDETERGIQWLGSINPVRFFQKKRVSKGDANPAK